MLSKIGFKDIIFKKKFDNLDKFFFKNYIRYYTISPRKLFVIVALIQNRQNQYIIFFNKEKIFKQTINSRDNLPL